MCDLKQAKNAKMFIKMARCDIMALNGLEIIKAVLTIALIANTVMSIFAAARACRS